MKTSTTGSNFGRRQRRSSRSQPADGFGRAALATRRLGAFPPRPGVTVDSLAKRLRRQSTRLSSVLNSLPVRQIAIEAASGTTPFSVLFLGFSFFIIAAAVMLIALLVQAWASTAAPRRSAHWPRWASAVGRSAGCWPPKGDRGGDRRITRSRRRSRLCVADARSACAPGGSRRSRRRSCSFTLRLRVWRSVLSSG